MWQQGSFDRNETNSNDKDFKSLRETQSFAF